MSDEKEDRKIVKLTVNVLEPVEAMITLMAARHGMSKTDVINQAIALAHAIDSVHRAGDRVTVDHGATFHTIEIGPW